MVVSGHSPKRRRTDNGPVSADSIAQANSHLQAFIGHRHNRWMNLDPVDLTANDEHAATSPRQTPLVSMQWVKDGEEAAFHGSGDRGLSFSDRAETSIRSMRKSPNVAGTMNLGASSTCPANSRGTNTVQYESPSSSNLPSSTASVNHSSRKSLDHMAREHAQPGLPSPAPSDEFVNSPTTIDRTSVSGSAASMNDSAQRGGLGRPRISQPTVPSSGIHTTATGSPVTGIHHRFPAQPKRPQYDRSVSQQANMQPPWKTHAGPSFGSYGSPSVQRRPSLVLPSQAHAFRQSPQQMSEDSNSAFNPASMRSRIDVFQATELPKVPPQEATFSSGRLALLRDAIDNEDWFYIVLSQIHCLTLYHQLLPESVKRLDGRSFATLDTLLCSNQSVSRSVINWMAEFPAPIMSIYSSQKANLYDAFVQAVVGFLERLALHWDTIVFDSARRKAPPLTEDLFDMLGLSSPVLQTTAFRAVGRRIWDANNGVRDYEKGLATLETLHRMDQALFAQGRRRLSQDKKTAYLAYAGMLDAWKEHERRVRQHQKRQEHVPTHSRQSPPVFAMPSVYLSIFQAAPRYNIPSAQLAAHGIPPHQMTTAEQQQANGQTLLQTRRTSVNGRASTDPTSATQQPPPTPIQHQNMVMIMPPQRFPPGPHLAFPHENEQPRAQPTQPETARTALHHAHLRSPTIGPLQAEPDAHRLYRYVVAYALSPRKVNKDVAIHKMNFRVPKHTIDRIPATLPSPAAGEPPVRMLDETSQTFRLRCVAFPASGFPDETAWVRADNAWPESLYVELNGQALEPRRKLQHGRYLPIDLTEHITGDENELRTMVNRTSTDTRPFEYAIAVEIVGVLTHQSITANLPMIAASDSAAAIKQSLSGIDSDDDVAITSSNLTIKLFDPYSGSKIFDTPVRGLSCAHRDCFDLETFLGICKRQNPGWPTVVDCWRCPLCRGDARPQMLVVDGFLVEVRKELAERNQLDTRAIVVETGGSWKPKVEERTGVRSASLECEERSTSARKSASAAPKKVPEVIEVD